MGIKLKVKSVAKNNPYFPFLTDLDIIIALVQVLCLLISVEAIFLNTKLLTRCCAHHVRAGVIAVVAFKHIFSLSIEYRNPS